jgi:hypothetical protein
MDLVLVVVDPVIQAWWGVVVLAQVVFQMWISVPVKQCKELGELTVLAVLLQMVEILDLQIALHLQVSATSVATL